MVTAAKDLEIGTTSKRRPYADNQLALRSLGNWHLLNANIFTAVKYCGLHRSLAKPASRLDRIATDLNYVFNGISTDMKNFLDCISTDVEDIFNGVPADLEDIFDRSAAAFDGALYRVWHRVLLQRLQSC